MKLAKAIEIVSLYTMGSQGLEPKDFEVALRLLIEAGKQININHPRPGCNPVFLLPGETEY